MTATTADCLGAVSLLDVACYACRSSLRQQGAWVPGCTLLRSSAGDRAPLLRTARTGVAVSTGAVSTVPQPPLGRTHPLPPIIVY